MLGVGTKTLGAQKVKEDNISQLGDNDEPFPEQQHKHGSCYIFLFKFKSFDQLNTPKRPQILDIYSVVAPWVKGYHEYIGGYHDYIRGCSVHQRDFIIYMEEQLDKILSITIENSNVLNIPNVLTIRQCTYHISPMYSWYPSNVLNINQYTHGIPLMYWTPPNVLMVSLRCTHGIPLMYSW